MDVTPSPGDVLLEKHRVERILGEGGMGVVLAATHLQLDQPVALKFLTVDVTSADTPAGLLTRFEREAKAAARLSSEHVARVFDFGRLPGGSPYIVMEYLDGRDASQLVEDEGPLPVDRAVELVLQAALGLAEAHTVGIVHRDIKPANLFITRRRDGREVVKILDFGISKLTDAGSDAKLTGGGILGSPLYMSPEQIKTSRNVDHRTDIWSLGTVLYELLTGIPPFVADTIPEVYLSIVGDQAKPPSEFADVPAELDRVLGRALAKGVSARYQTVAGFAHDLLPFAPARARALVEAIERIIVDSPLSTDMQTRPPPKAAAGETAEAVVEALPDLAGPPVVDTGLLPEATMGDIDPAPPAAVAATALAASPEETAALQQTTGVSSWAAEQGGVLPADDPVLERAESIFAAPPNAGPGPSGFPLRVENVRSSTFTRSVLGSMRIRCNTVIPPMNPVTGDGRISAPVTTAPAGQAPAIASVGA